MQHDLSKTVRHAGILAAGCLRDGRMSVAVRGQQYQDTLDHWLSTFQIVFNTVQALGQDKVRISFDNTILNVMRRDNHQVVIASEQGHVVTKSLQRMMRRLLKNVDKGEPEQAGAFSVATGSQRAPSPPPRPVADPVSNVPSVASGPSDEGNSNGSPRSW